MMINIFVPVFLRQMQALKRMEHALTTATEQLQHTQSVFNGLQAQVTDCYFQEYRSAVLKQLECSQVVFGICLAPQYF